MEPEFISHDNETGLDKLLIAEEFYIGGRKKAVICPICGHQEHVPDIGEPTEEVKDCETFVRFGSKKPKQYRVIKRAA